MFRPASRVLVPANNMANFLGGFFCKTFGSLTAFLMARAIGKQRGWFVFFFCALLQSSKCHLCEPYQARYICLRQTRTSARVQCCAIRRTVPQRLLDIWPEGESAMFPSLVAVRMAPIPLGFKNFGLAMMPEVRTDLFFIATAGSVGAIAQHD